MAGAPCSRESSDEEIQAFVVRIQAAKAQEARVSVKLRRDAACVFEQVAVIRGTKAIRNNQGRSHAKPSQITSVLRRKHLHGSRPLHKRPFEECSIDTFSKAVLGEQVRVVGIMWAHHVWNLPLPGGSCYGQVGRIEHRIDHQEIDAISITF
jgi:hypothetical protein